MVTLNSADNALKSFYLDAITDALNMKANPFLAMVQRTTQDVVGKDVKKIVRTGINGGICAGTETGELPSSKASNYITLTATLKNLYGTLEISDKAFRAAAKDEGAFVNLLNEEMNHLIKSANRNFGRMLFGTGDGGVGSVEEVMATNKIKMYSMKNIAEGMCVDIYYGSTLVMENINVLAVDKQNKMITVTETSTLTSSKVPMGSALYVHGSRGNEISGLDAIFLKDSVYGVNKDIAFMKPVIKEVAGNFDEELIETTIDEIEEASGGKINVILCSRDARRALVKLYRDKNVAVPMQEVDGVNVISFNGIPVIVDDFCPNGRMYLLNTEDFKLHQLCDWQWMQAEDGKILKQVPGKPVYTATLVKYAELMCEKPCGQGLIAGIGE